MVSTVNADRIHQLLLEENGWSDRFVLVWRLAGVGLLELGSWNPFAAFGLLGAEVDREAFVYLLLGLVGLAMFYTGQYLDMQAPTWERFVYMRAHPDFRNLLDRMKAVQQDLPLVHQEATVPPSAIEGSQDVDLFATAVPMVGMLCGFAWPGVVTQAATLPIMYERLGQVKDRMSKWLQDERVGPPEFVNSNATNLLTWCMHVHAYTSFVELTSYVVAVAGCLCITVSWFLAFFCYMGFGQHFQYTLATDDGVAALVWRHCLDCSDWHGPRERLGMQGDPRGPHRRERRRCHIGVVLRAGVLHLQESFRQHCLALQRRRPGHGDVDRPGGIEQHACPVEAELSGCFDPRVVAASVMPFDGWLGLRRRA